MSFTVVNINNASTIQVTPKWKWIDMYGDIVKIYPFKTSLQNNEFIMAKLRTLLQGQSVVLKNPKVNEDNVLECSVFLNDIDVYEYFPELKIINS